MNIRAVIIDDEKSNRENLQQMLTKHCKEVVVVAEAANAETGIQIIHEHEPTLVFLDIQMPGKNGFEMLESIGNISFEVVFVTAFDQYAIKAISFVPWTIFLNLLM